MGKVSLQTIIDKKPESDSFISPNFLFLLKDSLIFSNGVLLVKDDLNIHDQFGYLLEKKFFNPSFRYFIRNCSNQFIRICNEAILGDDLVNAAAHMLGVDLSECQKLSFYENKLSISEHSPSYALHIENTNKAIFSDKDYVDYIIDSTKCENMHFNSKGGYILFENQKDARALLMPLLTRADIDIKFQYKE